MANFDSFTSAGNFSGASGWLTGVNIGAGTEPGEPGHLTYSPGPSYPRPNVTLPPNATVWYAWTCHASGDYFFTTQNRTPGSGISPNFPSTLNVYIGSAVNSLARVTLLRDQSVGESWGVDNGASVAFSATSGTVYYIQIDTRVASQTGYFTLSWGPWQRITLGDCGKGPIWTDPSVSCLGYVGVTDLTTNGFYPFLNLTDDSADAIPALPGILEVVLAMGNGIPQINADTTPCAGIVDGNAAGFQIWADLPDSTDGVTLAPQPGYATGAIVCAPGNAAFAVAIKDVPACAPNAYGGNDYNGPSIAGWYWVDCVGWTGTSPGNPPATGKEYGDGDPTNPLGTLDGYDPNQSYNVSDYFGITGASLNTDFWVVCTTAVPAHAPYGNSCGIYWNCLPEYAPPVGTCANTVIPHHAKAGIMGMAVLGNSAAINNSKTNPVYQLIYYDIEAAIALNNINSISPQGGRWQLTFYVYNKSSLTFDATTFALQYNGGVTGPSAPITMDVVPGLNLVGTFTFSANPSAGLITAYVQLSRSGVNAQIMKIPLYPVIAAVWNPSYYGPGFWRTCSNFGLGPNQWNNRLYFYLAWPTSMSGFDPAWGNTFTYAFQTTDGTPFSNDSNPCYNVSSITGTDIGGGYISPDIQGSSDPTSVAIQCAFTYNGQTLPMFSQTVTIPAL